jgi:hypothetical protein
LGGAGRSPVENDIFEREEEENKGAGMTPAVDKCVPTHHSRLNATQSTCKDIRELLIFSARMDQRLLCVVQSLPCNMQEVI